MTIFLRHITAGLEMLCKSPVLDRKKKKKKKKKICSEMVDTAGESDSIFMQISSNRAPRQTPSSLVEIICCMAWVKLNSPTANQEHSCRRAGVALFKALYLAEALISILPTSISAGLCVSSTLIQTCRDTRNTRPQKVDTIQQDVIKKILV